VKKLKIMIIIVLILICIVSILLFITSKEQKQNDITNLNNIHTNNTIVKNTIQNTVIENYPNREKVDIESKEVSIVENRTDYFTVQSIVNKYLNILISKNQENLLDILDKNYANNNIANIQNYENNQSFTADKMYYRVDNNISTYFVYGTIEEQIMDEKMPENEFNITVIIDYNTNAFSIIPQEIVDIYSYKYTGSNIEVNKNNTYTNIVITDENMANLYLNAYKENTMYNIEKAFNSLNEEYRNNRFQNVEKYKQYLNKKYESTALVKLDKYLIKQRDGYVEYTLIDTYGNYYIFNEKSVMNYEVILDTYTIDIPEFVGKYNEADEELKVQMNLGRFFEALKQEDYKYAYEKLEDGFKSQHFNTVSEFEEYAKTTFIYDEEVEYNEFSNLDGIYTCAVELQHGENVVEKAFTVELLEGTDYRISFNID